MLYFQPLHMEYENGPLRGYKVQYKAPLQPRQETASTLPNSTHLVIDNLLPWRLYAIQVAAYNDAGTGPYSKIVQVRTLPEGEPLYPVITLKLHQFTLIMMMMVMMMIIYT